jgi:hypothetical protein
MADRYDPKLSVRPASDRKPSDARRGEAAADEDPLVELARIVSGRSPFDMAATGKNKTVPSNDPAMSSADFAGDLEAELLNNLQASFAAIQEPVAAAPAPPPPAPPPSEPQVRAERPVRAPSPERTGGAATPQPPAAPASPRQPIVRPAPERPELAAVSLRPTVAANPEPPAAPPAAEVPVRPPASRWAKQEEIRVQPPEPSRFAPPRGAAARPPAEPELALDDLAPLEEEPFGEGLPFAEDQVAGEAEAEFPPEGFDMVPGYGDEDQIPPFPEEELASLVPRRSGRGVILVAAILAVVVIGGAGVIMLRSGGGSSGTPPIIVADTTPTKVTPDATSTADDDHQNKLIYDRVDNGSGGGDTKLVTPNDQPVTNVPPAADAGSNNAISRVIIPGGPGIDGPLDKSAAPDTADTGDGSADTTIGPRKVRTVTVRPDGTIVSSSASPADGADNGNAANPPPTEPAATATAPPAAPKGGDVATDANGNYSNLPPVTKVGPTAAATAPPAGDTSAKPAAVPTPPKKVAVKTPVPVARPPASPAGTAGPLDLSPGSAPALPAPTPVSAAPAPAVAASGGGFLVQLSSQKSEDAARSTYHGLQTKFPSLLGALPPDIQRADLGARGIYFRVRVALGSQADAQQLCANLKAAGGDCILAR